MFLTNFQVFLSTGGRAGRDEIPGGVGKPGGTKPGACERMINRIA